MARRVEFFEASRGSSPPKDFLLDLPPKAQAKIARAINLLEEYGPRIGEPYVKAIAGKRGLWELRVRLGSDAFRLFFFAADERRLVVLHGIRKKTDRIAQRDLDVADQRMADYMRRR